MEYEKIQKLIEDMENSKLTELSIDFPDGTKINIKKEASMQQVVNVQENRIIEGKVEEKKEQEKVTVEERKIVTSPMVGTFYLKPAPNADPYIEVGKKVKKGDVLCIIEAMKLMNEIESEFDGEIKEILVKDGEVVEYGKPLAILGTGLKIAKKCAKLEI